MLTGIYAEWDMRHLMRIVEIIDFQNKDFRRHLQRLSTAETGGTVPKAIAALFGQHK